MKLLKQEVVKTLLYFDIFSFPLKQEEIHRFCQVKVNQAGIAATLDELEEEGQLQQHGPYYAMREGKRLARLREQKFTLSTEKMKTARKNAAFISQFPFVRGVAISGSLSKYAADESADIDFFIITKAQRLWICRSFLHCFKKLTFLFGKQHDFCMNYFLDEDELALKDRNLYTAFESLSIIPVFGSKVHRAFYEKNKWAKEFFPNCDPSKYLQEPLLDEHNLLKRIFETLFHGQWGNWVNQNIQKITVSWWRKKFERRGFEMAFFDKDLRATTGESKYHPNDYQRTILSAYEERLRHYQVMSFTPDL
ncbi:MAG: hypothetical protein R2828_02970 [Saprospiraceae bacterium]